MTEDRHVALGRIARAHGIKGQLKLEPYNDASEALPAIRTARLTLPDGTQRDCRIIAATPHPNYFLLTLAGVSTRDDAEALTGAELSVPRPALPALEDGEVYLVDLLGLPVVTDDGVELGELVDVMETGANDVLVVGRAGSDTEILIPDIEGVVLEADPEKGRILVRVPPGLIDGWD